MWNLIKGKKRLDDEVFYANLVSVLLSNLYLPAESRIAQFVPDWKKIEALGMKDEPIEWDDLSCTQVKQHSDHTELLIENAEAGKCPNLCAYLEKYLTAWGYRVKVYTA